MDVACLALLMFMIKGFGIVFSAEPDVIRYYGTDLQ